MSAVLISVLFLLILVIHASSNLAFSPGCSRPLVLDSNGKVISFAEAYQKLRPEGHRRNVVCRCVGDFSVEVNEADYLTVRLAADRPVPISEIKEKLNIKPSQQE